jgi:5-methylthioribose kinase
VSSDIVKITMGDRVLTIKSALPKLKVKADWRAPVERNLYEVEWLKVAGQIAPGSVPEVLAHDPASGSFAMSYLEPASHPVWKGLLRDGQVDIGFTAAVGRTIGEIHQATSDDVSLRSRFATDRIFHPIRLEPYLEATALQHPGVADRLHELSRRTLATKQCLVHGDVSPKNILVGPTGPVFLDAECAWYGDPAFDLAFCLNHLLLKCVWNRAASPALLNAFEALGKAYLSQVRWTSRRELEARAAQILPALFLARVDGKSPVEYITSEPDKDLVRSTALPLIKNPVQELQAIRAAWGAQLS